MIVLDRLSKSYDGGASFAVKDVSARIDRGNLMVLVGVSGCGKTTTLKMINRLVEPTSGRATIDDADTQDLDPVRLRREIGYVFQGIGLFPHMTVARNVGIVPSLLGWARPEIDRRVQDLLEVVGLEPRVFSDRRPAALSGGQQQRVGVARALAARPRLLLMDEPFGALDPITRDQLQQDFKALQQRLELTVIMVTHDMTEALLMADRIAVMREGRIVGLGTPHELMHLPQDQYVRALLETPRRQAEKVEAMASPGPPDPS
jgi:osmoprotectant transport system ATP-binding protein